MIFNVEFLNGELNAATRCCVNVPDALPIAWVSVGVARAVKWTRRAREFSSTTWQHSKAAHQWCALEKLIDSSAMRTVISTHFMRKCIQGLRVCCITGNWGLAGKRNSGTVGWTCWHCPCSKHFTSCFVMFLTIPQHLLWQLKKLRHRAKTVTCFVLASNFDQF